MREITHLNQPTRSEKYFEIAKKRLRAWCEKDFTNRNTATRENIKNSVYELANFIHLEYERFAQKTNWDTNEKCKVAFDDLPEANKKTMLLVAESVLAEIKQKLLDKSTFEGGVSSNGWYQIYKDDLDSIL